MKESLKIKEGTLHADYTPATYRTKDGSAYYKFQYIDIGGKFEMDILEQPSYQGRDDSWHIIHVEPSARGGLKICIAAGHEPKTIEGAKNISMQWAELTHEYIRTGRTLDQQVGSKIGGFWKWLFGWIRS